MALREAWLTPRRHSLAASPVCSPGAASRRVLHTSSHSKGCRLEDRKRCALSPPLDAEGTVSCPGALQPRDWKRGVSQATISTQSRHPLGQTHCTSQLDLATDRAPVRPLLPSGPCSSPSLSTRSMSLAMVPVYQWHGSFSQLKSVFP